jgi:RIO kinase 1
LKTPKRLETLVEEGIIDEVMRQLMSGKEATVYVVRCGDDMRCAKVYKDANKRNFRQASLYTESRKTKSTRATRAMAKRTKFGREVQETAWQSVEVDALYRLSAAGVRVPRPYGFYQGVVLMELLTDADGHAAPRLNDLVLTEAQALEYHRILLAQIVRMLCAGVIHADLSEYNVLVGSDGLVIIDLPQALDAAGNNNAAGLLERDVANMTAYFGRFAPEILATDYGREIWKLYATGELSPETVLTGRFVQSGIPADVHGVMRDVESARRWHERNI